jgi:hypothetical protein
MDSLSTIIALLIALSVASERLVEITKGLVPFLSQENPHARKECLRIAFLQILAVIAGIVTTLLARPAIEGVVTKPFQSTTGMLALGLLASGGSGLWKSVSSYVSNVKDIKKAEAQKEKKETDGNLVKAAAAGQ